MSRSSVIDVHPSEPTVFPPVILVHGAANSASVWRLWQKELAERGWSSYALDLRGHGNAEPIDIATTGMHDYAVDVGRLVDGMRQKPVIVGWSMGGLVAQIVAGSGRAAAWVGLEPSPPAQKVDDSLPLRTGVFDPTEYGIISSDPLAQPVMPDLDIEERKIALTTLGPESRLARDERKRGVVIDSVPCPMLVVMGTGPEGQARQGFDAAWLDSDTLVVEGVSHWGLVLNRRVLRKLVDEVVGWLGVNGVGRPARVL